MTLEVGYTYLSLHHKVSLISHLTHKSKHINTILLAYPLQHNIQGDKSPCATNPRTTKTTKKTSFTKATGNPYGSHYEHFDLIFLSTSGIKKPESMGDIYENTVFVKWSFHTFTSSYCLGDERLTVNGALESKQGYNGCKIGQLKN